MADRFLMDSTFKFAQQQAQEWIGHYGYGAVLPAMLIDPTGIPWAWIFLMLLAGEAGKSVPLMLALGFTTVSAFDHIFYWIGARGGRPLMKKLRQKYPKIANGVEQAERAVHDNGLFSVVIGRFLPFVGRYVGLGAGLSGLSYARFALYDAIGAGIIAIGFGWGAHLIGRKTINQPWFAPAVGWFAIGVTLLTLGFMAWHGYRAWSHRAQSAES